MGDDAKVHAVGQGRPPHNRLDLDHPEHFIDSGAPVHHAENVVVAPASASSLKAGKTVKMAIRDGGTGIAPEHAPRIFDPYFTTKQKGSGPKLAMAHSIVEKHDGYLVAESELNRGATFTVYLSAASSCKLEWSGTEPVLTTGKARVLLMDDEKDIRQVGCEMLRALGYEAENAADGNEAQHICGRAMESGKPFDAVILDPTIPGGLGGKEAVREILERGTD